MQLIRSYLQWCHQQVHEAPHDGTITRSQARTEEGGRQGAATHSQRRGSTRLQRRPQGSHKLGLRRQIEVETSKQATKPPTEYNYLGVVQHLHAHWRCPHGHNSFDAALD